VKLRLHLLVALAALVLVAGCGGGGDSASPPTTTVAAPPTTAATTTTSRPPVSHAAPDLEALLPGAVDGHRLEKGSTTGASVLSGGDAFSRQLTRFLAAAGKQPIDLRFANAQDPTGTFEVEVGVFQVEGMKAPALRDAIVESSRPNAPGLQVSQDTLGGKPVTSVVYPGGTALYLYEQGDHVFYVGTQSRTIAASVVERLP
jgi:hypothetical protein